MRCWVLTMYLSKLIFLSVSNWTASPDEEEDDDVEDLDFSFSLSTSSFSATNESSAALVTRAENSTVSCPSSAPISSKFTIRLRDLQPHGLKNLGFFLSFLFQERECVSLWIKLNIIYSFSNSLSLLSLTRIFCMCLLIFLIERERKEKEEWRRRREVSKRRNSKSNTKRIKEAIWEYCHVATKDWSMFSDFIIYWPCY